MSPRWQRPSSTTSHLFPFDSPSCLAASARGSSLLCTSCAGGYPLVGRLSYTPPALEGIPSWDVSPIHLLHWKVSPRGTFSYTPPSLEGNPSWDSLLYTSCTGRYHLPSSASPMDASLAAVNKYSTQTERYKTHQNIAYTHTFLEPALSESLRWLSVSQLLEPTLKVRLYKHPRFAGTLVASRDSGSFVEVSVLGPMISTHQRWI